MSTSLSDLPLPPGQQNNDYAAQQQFDLNSMIDVAANQANQQHPEEPNISAGALQYQMDTSQIPYNGPNPNIQINEDQYMDPAQYEMMQMQQEQETELTLVQRLTNEIKIPIIVAVLFVILSLPQFNQILTRFVPRFLSETGEMNLMGLAAKAALIAILVMLVKLFL
jgi:hypothetical protein